MTDAKALEMLKVFGVQHGLCGERALSTEFSEDREPQNINVVKRCQACNVLVGATVTRNAATDLLRDNPW